MKCGTLHIHFAYSGLRHTGENAAIIGVILPYLGYGIGDRDTADQRPRNKPDSGAYYKYCHYDKSCGKPLCIFVVFIRSFLPYQARLLLRYFCPCPTPQISLLLTFHIIQRRYISVKSSIFLTI